MSSPRRFHTLGETGCRPRNTTNPRLHALASAERDVVNHTRDQLFACVLLYTCDCGSFEIEFRGKGFTHGVCTHLMPHAVRSHPLRVKPISFPRTDVAHLSLGTTTGLVHGFLALHDEKQARPIDAEHLRALLGAMDDLDENFCHRILCPRPC